MALTEITVLPSAVNVGTGWTNTGGAASLQAALADSSDATYGASPVYAASSSVASTGGYTYRGTPLSIAFTDIPVSATQRIEHIRVTVRGQGNTLLPGSSYTAAANWIAELSNSNNVGVSGISTFTGSSPDNGGTYQTAKATTSTITPNGVVLSGTAVRLEASTGSTTRPLTPAEFNSLNLVIASNDGGQNLVTSQVSFSDFTLTALVNTQPVVSNVSPSTAQVTPTPVVNWTVTDPEDANVGTKYQVKIFSAAQYGAVGFSADTSTATWDSGLVTGGATSVTVGTALADGSTYRAYVTVYDSSNWQSAWAFSTFTVSLTVPNVPDLTAALDTPNLRVQLLVQGHDNLFTGVQADFETAFVSADIFASTGGWGVSQSSAFALRGTYSMLLTMSGTANPTGYFLGPVNVRNGSGKGWAVVPGQTYTFRMSARAAATARTFAVTMLQYVDATTSTATSQTSNVLTDAVGSWTTGSVSFTIPAGINYIELNLNIAATPAASELHYIDQMQWALGTAGQTPWVPGGFLQSGTYFALIERSLDSGATWSKIRSANGTTTAVPSGVTSSTPGAVTVYDYEVPLNISTVQYRVRFVGIPYGASASAAGSNSTTQNVGALTSQDWYIKSTANPLTVVALLRVVDSHKIKIQGQQGVYYALGRRKPIVIVDVISGDDGEVSFDLLSQAEYNALHTVLIEPYTLLLQSPFNGDQWYIRPTNERAMVRENNTSTYWTGSFSYVEVDSGV